MKRRMPAEWENPKRILLSVPGRFTDWNYILNDAITQYKRIINALSEGGEELILLNEKDRDESTEYLQNPEGSLLISDIEYNDTWTRDYGLITVKEDDKLLLLDFGFNGWGLKFAADHDNLVNLRLMEKGIIDPLNYRNHRDFILEGGSIESDGNGTILTTSRCLCSPNRNGGKSKEELEKILSDILGAERVLWLDYGFLEGDDTDSHIDTLARLAPDDTIVYIGAPSDIKDCHHEELVNMERQLQNFRTKEGKPYKLIRLPFPYPIFDEGGHRLPATYANYLVTGKNIFVPTYRQPENDSLAIEALRKAFPNHKVFTIECLTLIRQHGSLHCSTMQLYE